MAPDVAQAAENVASAVAPNLAPNLAQNLAQNLAEDVASSWHPRLMPPTRRSAPRPAAGGVSAFEARPARVVLLTGTDSALADMAISRIERTLRAEDPDVERHLLDTSTATAGDLSQALTPSLFGGARLVVVTGLEAAAGALSNELLETVATWDGGTGPDDVTLIARHAGGAGGKAVLGALRALPDLLTVDCTPATNDRSRAELAHACARSLGAAIDGDAVAALVEATGNDTAELLALVRQLVAMADVNDTRSIALADTRALVSGRRDASGFDVADALVSGDAADGLALLRHAQGQRVEPILIVGAVASKMRTMARVAAAGRGAPAAVARALALAPWQVERAQRDLRHWTPESLAEALVALADADAAIKGEEGAVPGWYALERAALGMLTARSQRRRG